MATYSYSYALCLASTHKDQGYGRMGEQTHARTDDLLQFHFRSLTVQLPSR